MIRFTMKIFIGIVLFGLLIWYVGWAEIIKNLVLFKWTTIFILIGTTFFGYFIAGCGIFFLGRAIRPDLPWLFSLQGFFATVSLSIFVPGRVGDLALPYYWRDFMRPGECMAILFLDKMISTFWVLIFGGIGMSLMFNNRVAVLLPIIMILALVILIALMVCPQTRLLITGIMPDKLRLLLEGSIGAFRIIATTGKKSFFFTILLSFLRIFIYGVAFWISLWGVNLSSPFFYSVFVMGVAQYTSFIPVSFMGIGTVEAVCVYAFDLIGIAPEKVLAALVVGRLITMFWLVLFFVKFNVNRGINAVVK